MGMAEQARQHGQLAGSARLVLVQGPALLHPERTVFDAMLAGWQAQQRSRLLADTTVLWRERIVRRFAELDSQRCGGLDQQPAIAKRPRARHNPLLSRSGGLLLGLRGRRSLRLGG